MTDRGEAKDQDPLASLLAVQDADLHADRLVHQIEHHPIRIEQREADASRVRLAIKAADLEAEAEVHRRRQAELEAAITVISERILTIEARMRSIAAGSFRDQEAMAAEVESLHHHRSELEDEELTEMVVLEPIEGALRELAAADAELAEQVGEKRTALAAAVADLEVELAALHARRPSLVQGVPQPLVEEYERLRTRLGGIGAARVVRGACSGCNLALSSIEIDHLRHASAGSVSHCEQCGRILVLA